MNRCQWCGKNSSGYGMVVLTIKGDEPSQSICEDCYNRYMADILGVEDYKDYEKEATCTDCDGIEHCFQIRKKIHPTGICWEAVEFTGVDKIGYSFEVYQDFEEDSNYALKRLYKKIRKGLSQKFIKEKYSKDKNLSLLKGI